MIARVNDWFDTLPRMWFDVGTRRVPAFRSLGIVGYHVAVVVLVLTALRTGLSLGLALVVAAIAGLSFFGWGLLRRAITKRETLVVMEHVWIAYGLIAGFAWAIGVPIAPVVDVFSVGVATFVAFGRFGCATVGCCHGYPSRFGIRYGPDHHLPARLTGARLFPVQLLEAGALLLISVIGFLCTAGPPGTATVWFLASYAVARYGLQRLRFDRPTLAGRAQVARGMCVLQLGAAVVLDLLWRTPATTALGVRVPEGPVVAAVTAISVASAVVVLMHTRHDQSVLTHPDHLDEVWADLTAPVPTSQEPVARTTSRGMTVATSRFGGVHHVSFSHPEAETLPVAIALGAPAPFVRNGITHFGLTDPDPEAGALTGDAAPRGAEPMDSSSPTMHPATVDAYFSAPARAALE